MCPGFHDDRTTPVEVVSCSGAARRSGGNTLSVARVCVPTQQRPAEDGFILSLSIFCFILASKSFNGGRFLTFGLICKFLRGLFSYWLFGYWLFGYCSRDVLLV